MGDSLSHLDDLLHYMKVVAQKRVLAYHLLNYNDKETYATLCFSQLRKRVSAEHYFGDLKFECTSTSAIR